MYKLLSLIGAILAILALGGCTSNENELQKVNPNVGGPIQRFEIISTEYIGYEEFSIIRDTKTGREYLYVEGAQGRGGVVELRGEE